DTRADARCGSALRADRDALRKPRRARRRALRCTARPRARDLAGEHRSPHGIRSMTREHADALTPRILDYLGSRLPDARGLTLEDVQRIAVGWSHETWLFDLTWREGSTA